MRSLEHEAQSVLWEESVQYQGSLGNASRYIPIWDMGTSACWNHQGYLWWRHPRPPYPWKSLSPGWSHLVGFMGPGVYVINAMSDSISRCILSQPHRSQWDDSEQASWPFCASVLLTKKHRFGYHLFFLLRKATKIMAKWQKSFECFRKLMPPQCWINILRVPSKKTGIHSLRQILQRCNARPTIGTL